MGNFFSVDSPVINFLNKVCDVILLSIVFIICCIPVITIGPALTALYYTTVKVIRRERGYMFKEFFKSFKTNFKSGVFLTFLFALALYILYIDRNYAVAMAETNQQMAFILSCIFNAISVIVFLTLIYAFPVLSRFTVKGFQLMKTSFFMSIRHLPSTILVAAILIVAGLGMYLIPILFIIVPALAAFLCSFMIERVFRKYMPAPNENAEEEGTDEWYWE